MEEKETKRDENRGLGKDREKGVLVSTDEQIVKTRESVKKEMADIKFQVQRNRLVDLAAVIASGIVSRSDIPVSDAESAERITKQLVTASVNLAMLLEAEIEDRLRARSDEHVPAQ